MNTVFEEAQQLIEAIKAETVNDAAAAEQFRIKYLGTKGIIKQMMGSMKDVPAENRKQFGLVMNEAKMLAEARHEEMTSQFAKTQAKTNSVDLTLPVTPAGQGSRHPINLVRRRIIDIFKRLGFALAEGPEIEDDWHNFGALNLPADHPARDMQDTFYISQDPAWMLRTHTSNVQIREMEKAMQPNGQHKLPLRLIMPGRVYRNETISARAHCFFHQVEGLYVAEQVSFADLKQTLYFFVKEMFGSTVNIRFRPSYFPFTEPSAEMDISCLICHGKGCNVCKQTGWVEILGCGMVHPNVLSNCGIDPDKYSGFAFGMGIERITMLKYQIKDLRLFSENDVRFLNQFRTAL